MTSNAGLPAANPLPDLPFDLAAADRVMICPKAGLRAYAEAGGLDPATDFRGLDMRGWDLAGQDLRSFDLSGCDLRGTGVEFALTDGTTGLDGASWDQGIIPGGQIDVAASPPLDLAPLLQVAREHHNKNDPGPLAAAADDLLPLLESLYGPGDPNILELRGYVGYGQLRSGDPEGAHRRLESLINDLREQDTPENSRQFMHWRYYGAEALHELGQLSRALAEYDAIIPFYQADGGPSDPSTLNARRGRAQILIDLGRAAEALAELDTLLPWEEVVFGPRHPATLSTREYRARALLNLGRTAEAFAEYDIILPLHEAVLGPRDPSTVVTRGYRARALLDLGRAAEALEQFSVVVAGFRGSKDDGHCWVAAARSDEIGCRMALGVTNAADQLLQVAEQLARTTYPHNLNLLRTRYRLARCLIASGQIEKAQVEIADLSALAAHPGVAEYRYFKAGQRLLGVIDGSDDGAGLPW